MNWNPIKRRRLRNQVVEAARGVAVSYTPELEHHQYDPDDLEYLRRAVVALYASEGQHGVVLSPVTRAVLGEKP